MSLFKDLYRVESTRQQNWDYSWHAKYFITIVTQNREHFFGEIVNAEIKLSDIGKIVFNEWNKPPILRPDMNITLGPFVIMPNHFHAIVEIGKNKYNQRGVGRRDAIHCVSTPTPTPTKSPTELSVNVPNSNKPKNKFGPQSKNLPAIVRGFKSAVTLHGRKINSDFAWQSRFHDRIIRNDAEFYQIRNYIMTNPEKWVDDTFNTGINP